MPVWHVADRGSHECGSRVQQVLEVDGLVRHSAEVLLEFTLDILQTVSTSHMGRV